MLGYKTPMEVMIENNQFKYLSESVIINKQKTPVRCSARGRNAGLSLTVLEPIHYYLSIEKEDGSHKENRPRISDIQLFSFRFLFNQLQAHPVLFRLEGENREFVRFADFQTVLHFLGGAEFRNMA